MLRIAFGLGSVTLAKQLYPALGVLRIAFGLGSVTLPLSQNQNLSGVATWQALKK